MTLDIAVAALAGSSLGLASSAHCALMCGPIALVTKSRGGAAASVPYYLGRVVSYACAGALAGSTGRLVVSGFGLRWAEAILSWTLALGLLCTAIALLRGRAATRLVQLRTKARSSRVGRMLARLADEPLLLGMATALLPCATLYAALVAAASLGSATAGAALMASFSVVTSAALFGVAQLDFLRGRGVRAKRVLGCVLALGAVIFIYRPLPGLLGEPAGAACPLHAAAVRGSAH